MTFMIGLAFESWVAGLPDGGFKKLFPLNAELDAAKLTLISGFASLCLSSAGLLSIKTEVCFDKPGINAEAANDDFSLAAFMGSSVLFSR